MNDERNRQVEEPFRGILNAFAEPARIVKCPVCFGDGLVDIAGPTSVRRCRYCGGRGRIATEGGEA